MRLQSLRELAFSVPIRNREMRLPTDYAVRFAFFSQSVAERDHMDKRKILTEKVSIDLAWLRYFKSIRESVQVSPSVESEEN